MNRSKNRVAVTIFSTTAKIKMFHGIIPMLKKDKELFVANEFGRIQKEIDNLPLSDIVKSTDDGDKRPDIICRLGERRLGIQLTELKFSGHANAASVSKRITQRILEIIKKRGYQAKERILVHIVGRFEESNSPIKLNTKEIESLVDLILNGIKGSRSSTPISQMLSSATDAPCVTLSHLTLSDNLRNKIRGVWFEKVPNGMDCYCPKANNIFMSTDFCSIVSSDALLSGLINDIYDKKNDGLSEMLLVWTGDPVLFLDAERITKIMRDRFKTTTFKWVYYFTFIGAETFYEHNCNSYRIV